MKLITRTLAFAHTNPDGIWFLDNYNEDTVIYFTELRGLFIDHSISYHVSDVDSVMHLIELVPEEKFEELADYWKELSQANASYWEDNNITVTEKIQDVVDKAKPALNV